MVVHRRAQKQHCWQQIFYHANYSGAIPMLGTVRGGNPPPRVVCAAEGALRGPRGRRLPWTPTAHILRPGDLGPEHRRPAKHPWAANRQGIARKKCRQGSLKGSPPEKRLWTDFSGRETPQTLTQWASHVSFRKLAPSKNPFFAPNSSPFRVRIILHPFLRVPPHVFGTRIPASLFISVAARGGSPGFRNYCETLVFSRAYRLRRLNVISCLGRRS